MDDIVDTSYCYNLDNNLEKVIKGTTETSMEYYADGLRAKKEFNDTSKATSYVYNLSGQLITEKQDIGSTNITSNYVWGPDRALVKKDSLGGEYYYLYNGHGDVVQMVDRNGNVVNNYNYDEWGNITLSNETVSNPFKYAGEVYDQETGLYYLRARYYDPTMGRFINEDTHWDNSNSIYGDDGYQLSDVRFPDINAIRQSSNLYVYGLNNPMLYIDSSGEFAFLVNMAICGVIGAAVSSGVQIYKNVNNGNKWYKGVGKAALAGGVSGAIAAIPIPGLSAAASAVIMSGAGNTVANLIKGDIGNFKDVLTSLGFGAIAGGIGYGGGSLLVNIANKAWAGLSREAQ